MVYVVNAAGIATDNSLYVQVVVSCVFPDCTVIELGN